MATADQVLVEMAVRNEQYLAGMRNAASAAAQVKKQLDTLHASLNMPMQGSSQMTTGLTRVRREATAAQSAMRNLEFSTSNLVAQINDIGVTAAGGMSPLLIALQQGTQLSQAFAGQSARASFTALGTAISSAVSPMNLMILAGTAAAAMLLQWGFSALQSATSAGEAEEAVKRLSDAFDQLAEAKNKAQIDIDKIRFGVDEGYQVELIREELRLRNEINMKVQAARIYQATTTDNIDRQRIVIEGLLQGVDELAAKHKAVADALGDQQNRAAQLAVIEGIRVQRANEQKARDEAAEEAAKRAAEQAKVALEQFEKIRLQLHYLNGSAVDIQIRFNAQYNNFIGKASEWLGGLAQTMTSIAEGGSPVFSSPRPKPAPALIDESAIPSPKKGGGGGGVSEAEKEYNDLLRERERILDSIKTPLQEYTKQLALIQQLSQTKDKKTGEFLISEEEAEAARKRLAQLQPQAQELASALRSAFDGLFDDPLEALDQLWKKLAQMWLYMQLAQSFPTIFGATGVLPLVKNAMGNVFSGPGISAYSGQVVSSPTMFAFAKGAGIMGEAGAEGILPLTRVNGKLGVSASGVGSGGTVFQLIDQRGAGEPPIERETRRGPNGEEIIVATVKQNWGRGAFDGQMQTRQGVSPRKVVR